MSANDLVARGSYKPSPLNRSVFVGLRASDPLIQYAIVSKQVDISWIPRLLGGELLPANGAANLLRLTYAGVKLALPPNPPYQGLLLCISIVAAMKQSYWAVAIGREEMLLGSAVTIAAFGILMNSIFNALAMWTRTSVNPTASSWTELLQNPYIAVGTALFVAGIAIETLSEIQRSRFKDDQRNKGKPYAGGLFGLARNINYTGFTLWKTGYALVAAGPVFAVVIATMHLYDFSQRAIPVLDEYCAKRYGQDWQNVRKKVPNVLIPGVY